MRLFRPAAAVSVLLLVAGCGDPTDPGLPAGFITTQVVFQDANVSATRVSYQAGGLSVNGQICRPTAAGRYPLLMSNHGGWGGLGAEWIAATSGCVALARAGNVVIEPSYRGEDGSEGTIELCLGEATDVRAMLELALDEPDVDPTQVRVLGGSHGACTTLRAIIDGAPLGRFVAVAGPTDWASAYQAMIDSIAAGASGGRLQGFQLLTADIRRYMGGTPAEAPAAYAARALVPRVTGLDGWAGALLIQHGVDDEIVPVEQSCALVAAATGFTSYHVAVDGAVVTQAPANCAASGITWSLGPLPVDWAGRRYLIVYDGYGHGDGPNAGRQAADAIAFLVH